MKCVSVLECCTTLLQLLHIHEVALLARQRTCDSQVAGLSPALAPLHSGQATYTYVSVPLSPSIVIWYQPRGGGDLFGWESNHRSGEK